MKLMMNHILKWMMREVTNVPIINACILILNFFRCVRQNQEIASK